MSLIVPAEQGVGDDEPVAHEAPTEQAVQVASPVSPLELP